MLEKTKVVLDLICGDELFSNYDIRFVGGTALSYLIKHRLSEDLDFAATRLPLKKIEEMMQKYGAIKLEHNITAEDYAKNEGMDIDDVYIKYMLNDVKVEFFTPPFNLFEQKNIWDKDTPTFYQDSQLQIASLNTIVYMKTMAFWNRKKYRDIFDIYYILKYKHCSAENFLKNYKANNITYTTEHLLQKIQDVSKFYEKDNDEGINTLVKDDKPYEWYRTKIEEYIHQIYIEELYKN